MKKNNTFERYESKYLLNSKQKEALLRLSKKQLKEDLFPHSQIVSIYFDTDDYRIIRASLEAKDYKEKLRLRQYFSDQSSSHLFIEIKRKVEGIVYKRRKDIRALDELDKIKVSDTKADQISHELHYFFQCHPDLKPVVLINYHRDAYIAVDDESFRLTLDTTIRSRFSDVYDLEDWSGDSILDEKSALLEVKTKWGYPRWFLDFLSENEVYESSFSKYGIAYRNRLEEERKTLCSVNYL